MGAFTLCKNVKVFIVPSSVTNTYQDTAFDEGVTIIKNGVSYVNKAPGNTSPNTGNNAAKLTIVQ